MKITINTFGTRGDVQPYIALGKGLQQVGHEVCVVSHQIFESFVKEHGLDFYPIDLDPREVLVNQAVAELGNNMLRIMRWMEKNFKLALEEIFKVTLDANRDADLMLNSGLSFAGWHVAEKLELPAIATYLWPAIPSRYIPPLMGKKSPSWQPLKGLSNYWSTKISNQTFFNLLLSSVNECRRDILDLPALSKKFYWKIDSPRGATPFVYGYSPLVIPKPVDWGDNQQVAGYWFLDAAEDYQPDDALRDFLASGPPPIYVGFGSMIDHEREEAVQIVADALQMIGQRGIMLSDWSGFDSADLPDSILKVESVPHEWLFPQMAAVVHHGGAGTTAAGLRAGVPSVIVPSFGDQFFWGNRIHEMGVGSQPIPRKKLTAEKLAKALQQVIENQTIRENAKRIVEEIRAENGVEKAVQMIETYARDGHF
ncbi:MAG: glycosyltransferase family 1 protein [Anaerolineae bacterium]|jgi:sterol 3beta-glucosyltransferase|nr:glycosyltransferase family 1 protein [Anaerolineae bacterium]MBT7072500.1 glycosyltransferase family 1 protein [Anaerolineae bacterium]MBT7325721.1 glycosyltransferase family 1 protein [Anaerolineae bacterium]